MKELPKGLPHISDEARDYVRELAQGRIPQALSELNVAVRSEVLALVGHFVGLTLEDLQQNPTHPLIQEKYAA